MVGGAEDAGLGRVVDAGRVGAAGERAHLLVAGPVAAAVGAVGADVLLHQVLARVLVHADALAVEPVLAPVASYHEPVVVGPAAEAVGAVVGLVRVLAVAAGPGAGAGAGAGAGGGARLFRGGTRLGLLGPAGLGLLRAAGPTGSGPGAFRGRLDGRRRALLLLGGGCSGLGPCAGGVVGAHGAAVVARSLTDGVAAWRRHRLSLFGGRRAAGGLAVAWPAVGWVRVAAPSSVHGGLWFCAEWLAAVGRGDVV